MTDTTRYLDDGSTFDVAAIPGYLDTWRVCVDCYYAVHGLENDTPDPRWPGIREDLARVIVADASTYYDADHGQALAEPSFGWNPCGACGTHVGGDRMTVDVIAK